MSGKINFAIVKALSRFVQNYGDTRRLIHNLFVQMGVGSISLVKDVGNYLNPNIISNIIVLRSPMWWQVLRHVYPPWLFQDAEGKHQLLTRD